MVLQVVRRRQSGQTGADHDAFFTLHEIVL
jgi:hypothetical protein